MEIYLSAYAEKQFHQLSTSIQKRIATKIRFYRTHENPLKLAKPLTGRPFFRFRIGDYRLVFRIIEKDIYIITIDKRSDVYRDL